jgi:DnaJ-class molecular chaperone
MHRCKVCNGRGVKVTLRQLGPGMVQQKFQDDTRADLEVSE